MILVDYSVAKECQNTEVYYACYKCGKCGRQFVNGYMVDDGGTTIYWSNDSTRIDTRVTEDT